MHVRKDKQSRRWWLAGRVWVSHSCVIWLPVIVRALEKLVQKLASLVIVLEMQ